jgi:hypothetical protein
MSTTPETLPKPPAQDAVNPVYPCADCGRIGQWPLLMNSTVCGHYERLCPDCREENDPDNVMQEPCCHCGGSGTEWEGWPCEYCEGSGVEDF